MKKLLIALFALIMVVSCAACVNIDNLPNSSGQTTESSEVEVQKHLIKFVDADGNVLEEMELEEGTIPEAPVVQLPANTAEFTYTGAWDQEIVAVNGEATYTWVVTATKNSYIVKFVDTEGNVLQESTLEYGVMPEAPAANTPANTVEFTYVGAWDQEIAEVSGEATYTWVVTATRNSYLVKFVDEEGNVLKEGAVEYGAMPEAPAPQLPANTAEFTYSGAWNQEIAEVSGEATYTWVVTATKNSYVVKFVDEEGTVLKESTLEYGAMPEAPATQTPANTVEFTYVGAWDQEIAEVSGEATYTWVVTATRNSYLVKFVDEEGNVLKEGAVEYGAMPEAPAPQLPANTAEFTYTGAWDKEISAVSGEATYTWIVTQTINHYDVAIANSNAAAGAVTGEGAEDLVYGTLINATANVVTIGEQQITATAALGYEFVKWQAVVGGETVDLSGDYEVVGNTTITPVWKLIIDDYAVVNSSANLSINTDVVFGNEVYSTALKSASWQVKFTLTNKVDDPAITKVVFYVNTSMTNPMYNLTLKCAGNSIRLVAGTWTRVEISKDNLNAIVDNAVTLTIDDGNNVGNQTFYFSQLYFVKDTQQPLSNYAVASDSAAASADTAVLYGNEEFSTALTSASWQVKFNLTEKITDSMVSKVSFFVNTNMTNPRYDLVLRISGVGDIKLAANTWTKIELDVAVYNQLVENGTVLKIDDGNGVDNKVFYFSGLYFEEYPYAPSSDYEIVANADKGINMDVFYGDEAFSTTMKATNWQIKFTFANKVTDPTVTKVIFFVNTDMTAPKYDLMLKCAGNSIKLTAGTWTRVELAVADFNAIIDNALTLTIDDGNGVNNKTFFFSQLYFARSTQQPLSNYAVASNSANASADPAVVYGNEDFSTALKSASWQVKFTLGEKVTDSSVSKVIFYVNTDMTKPMYTLQLQIAGVGNFKLTAGTWTKVEMTVEQYNALVDAQTVLKIDDGNGVNNKTFYFSQLYFA